MGKSRTRFSVVSHGYTCDLFYIEKLNEVIKELVKKKEKEK
ncbi:hypothetical protein HanRHA438_Chr09g0409921 [Helianthus annuus]|nr:hypothetical protein HanRHA438_Chr09g0409921 [Helianthus annuus]